LVLTHQELLQRLKIPCFQEFLVVLVHLETLQVLVHQQILLVLANLYHQDLLTLH
jgi:hypothetical protein